MARLEIDGVFYEVEAGANLLHTCLGLGLNLPYFCWHPALGSVGACRQCALIQYRDADDQRGRIVMACMTPVSDGLRISLQHPEARAFRAAVIELLMSNHPHDCPVCEEGGECHLQDMTVMTGHTRRRFHGRKRTHRNQDLGPCIKHEMNRCIACYRCVRYYRDYAGGRDLDVFGSRNGVYFGRYRDGTLESEFSGNLVEVCPTGVFTDKTLSARYSRKWDLQTAPSVCVHCSLGCNTSPGERYGELRRVVNRYHGEVNGYFLCDRGRFGYDFVNSPARVRQARIRDQQVISPEAALTHFKAVAADSFRRIGIGSPRASLEANFALRELVGPANFYLGLGRGEYACLEATTMVLASGSVHVPSLREVEQADAVLVLGEDPTHSAPRLALALRQALRQQSFDQAAGQNIPAWQDAAVRNAGHGLGSPLYIAFPGSSSLDELASGAFHGLPADIARFGLAVAAQLDAAVAAPAGLAADSEALAERIAQTLAAAQRPLVVAGSSSGEAALVRVAAAVARALPGRSLYLISPDCNSLGLGLLGGLPLADAFLRARDGEVVSAVILENDLYRCAPGAEVEAFLDQVEHVVVIDHIRHGTAEKAELLLPAASFAESEGTLVSSEGRAQRYFPVVSPGSEIRAAWRWLDAVKEAPTWADSDAVTAACAEAVPALAGIVGAAPGAGFRIKGLKIPRQPHRYSGRTAIQADRDVRERKAPEDAETALAFSMEGVGNGRPAALNPGVWAPGWNSNQAVTRFQTHPGGPLLGGDPGVRLLEAAEEIPPLPLPEVPAASRPKGLWQLLPLPRIFGSEPLSLLAPALAARAGEAYLVLNPADAARLGVKPGDLVELGLEAGPLRLPLVVDEAWTAGAVGVPQGLPGLPALLEAGPVSLRREGA